MNELSFSPYLQNPNQVQAALELLERECMNLGVKQLFFAFEKSLGIKRGDGYPIPRVFTKGKMFRARVNEQVGTNFLRLEDIGINKSSISQGRANPDTIPIFYASANRETTIHEVLQAHEVGTYIVTIGKWSNPDDLCIVNLVDGSDDDFKDLSFIHSLPNDYVRDWPANPKNSSMQLQNYFAQKMKAEQTPGLFNITNVLSAVCYSLEEVDGIGYGAVSNKFKGYNLAIKNYQNLFCESVEMWMVKKLSQDEYVSELLSIGKVEMNGGLIW